MDSLAVKIEILQGEHLDFAWQLMLRGIGAAVDQRVTSVESIYVRLKSGDLLGIEISVGGEVRAYATLEKVLYPKVKMLKVLTLHGNFMPTWLGAFERFVTKIARESGCAGVETYTRPGMVRALRQFGYEANSIMVRRMFDDGQRQQR